MRIEDAHEGRALCAKQAEVSPVSHKSHKHALRAMWIDDCELWVKMHSRPGRWPLEAAKRLKARGHAQKASAAPEHRAAEGDGGAQPRNTAQALAQRGA